MAAIRSRGVITLEFVLVFPILVGFLYGAAGYGVLFFTKSQMQVAVDRASSAVFSLDRRASADFSDDAIAHSNQVLEALRQRLPKAAADRVVESQCSVSTDGGLDLLECTLRAEATESGFLPQVNVFGLGSFPPLPTSLTARSSVAF
ncbi:MAG: hypothetical protein HLUCCX14_07715 [Marinobacter excellens HL-55]|uniref:TadE-like domain-containing protein n=1 Tax=Marinobacter excellens HL-55 TaxID=1305731 RepID=A0A0P7ZIG6_9GAMM|nr:MAG: hypothetical protein HLUCCX14_07715 [Marinobacter excellens HL-55]